VTVPGGPPRGWAARFETLEAMAALMLARGLVRLVRFARWRRFLGSPDAEPPQPAQAPGEAHRLARVVERGAYRLPGEALCLPRAMALAWMLRRRSWRPVLVIAIVPGHARGTLDDLHAWVELSGEILIGHSDLPHRPIARFA
jgi:hypothetical protein